ncbi:MAG: HD domain-containing phosphohydrolase [Candidatus Moraniibacteriota bacterium]
MTFEEKIFGAAYKKQERSRVVNESGATVGGGSHSSERRPEQERIEQQLCAGFDTLLEQLRRDPEALHERIERLRALPDCEGILGKLDPYFRTEHWEIAATLEAYDKRTFDHSLRVAAFVYDMASGAGETAAYMKSRVEIEQSSLEELFTAALFHDIGKTAIPNEILHDNHSRREWGKRANDWARKNGRDRHFDPEKLETLDEVELDHYFMQVHALNTTDPLNIVPLEEIFSPEILRELERHGISPHDTFRKVLECHEKATGAILRHHKMYVASDIASHHHDYEHRPIRLQRYQTETSVVRLGFELSILRSMDVYDALTSDDRSYKDSYHPLLALEILIKEAEIEFTEPELTKYVIRDLYKKLESSQRNIPGSNDESRALQKILTFIG